jgi:hypothetical protein
MLARKERYNNDPEYHNHIKRLEDELRRTDDPQHAEYLERRISKLRSLSEGVKLSRTSRAINEMARKKKVYQVVAKCDYRDRSTEYVCDEFTSKREALRYKKEECYDTPSRCHIIREVIKEDINEGERSLGIRDIKTGDIVRFAEILEAGDEYVRFVVIDDYGSDCNRCKVRLISNESLPPVYVYLKKDLVVVSSLSLHDIDKAAGDYYNR